MHDLTAVILAGGLGTRLRSAVPGRPKVLAEVAGRPFLAHLLDQLGSAGVRVVVLCTGYLGDEVRRTIGHSHGSLRLSYSQEGVPLGTAGALRQALPLLSSDPVLVLNGDSYCEVDLAAFRSWHLGRRARASLVVVPAPEGARYGGVTIGTDGLVTRFTEQSDGAGWINAGIYCLSPSLIKETAAGRAASLERELFPAWAGAHLLAYPSQGRFLDIGTPESYAKADRFFSAARA